jgi:hypothetical protein
MQTENMADSQSLPAKLTLAACLIGLSSFNFGYTFVSLNACLVTGNGNSPSACYNHDDDQSPSCPKGSIYEDLNLSNGIFVYY